MNIGSVNIDKVYPTRENEKTGMKPGEEAAAAEAKKSSPGDKLELSAEAQKLQPVKEKLAEGFYDKSEVIRDAALKISKQIKPETAG